MKDVGAELGLADGPGDGAWDGLDVVGLAVVGDCE
jgi:hypothetical protein